MVKTHGSYHQMYVFFLCLRNFSWTFGRNEKNHIFWLLTHSKWPWSINNLHPKQEGARPFLECFLHFPTVLSRCPAKVVQPEVSWELGENGCQVRDTKQPARWCTLRKSNIAMENGPGLKMYFNWTCGYSSQLCDRLPEGSLGRSRWQMNFRDGWPKNRGRNRGVEIPLRPLQNVLLPGNVAAQDGHCWCHAFHNL